jgi:hypothetical protein
MSKLSFPTGIESLSSEWLTQVLEADGALGGAIVKSFTGEPIGVGYTSSVYRLSLEYAADVVTAPKSLVVKFHGNTASTRELFESFGIYEKEVRFYQTIGRDRTLPVPICHAAEFDRQSGDFVILMEDLSAARSASWDDGGLADIRTGLTQLAEIHAKFWGDPQLRQHDWIAQPTDLQNPPPQKALWASNLAEVKKHHRDQLSDYSWSVCDKWLEYWDEIMLCISQDTHTLVHTDPHLGQMFFPTAELQRFVLFDWQYPSKSWGAEDVVHLIVSEQSVDDRRRHEESLVDLYFETLCQKGVSDLTKQRFWFQCKLSLLWLYFMDFNTVAEPGLLQSLQAEAQIEGVDWRGWIFGQLGPVTADWKMAEILDQAIEEARTGQALSR